MLKVESHYSFGHFIVCPFSIDVFYHTFDVPQYVFIYDRAVILWCLGLQLPVSIETRSWRCVLDTTLCDKVCQWRQVGGFVRVRRFPPPIKLTTTI
jgi:hypothetical protein